METNLADTWRSGATFLLQQPTLVSGPPSRMVSFAQAAYGSPMIGSEQRQTRTMFPIAHTGKWSLLTIHGCEYDEKGDCAETITVNEVAQPCKEPPKEEED